MPAPSFQQQAQAARSVAQMARGLLGITRHSLTVLSEDFIAERLRVLDTLDAQECGRCQTPVPYGAVEDAEWFIDSYTEVSDDWQDGYEIAVIRCPLCW